jgi:filamentous hemagglutinin family protein
MNKVYSIVWNDVRESYVVASENTTTSGKPASTVKCVVAALASALMAQAAYAAPAPNALPTGGQVVSGQATISQSSNAMTVNQGSNQAILNWNTFNIGANASVNFQQPSSSAVALNRVVGADPSAIYGSLTANGQVYLINPNGVLFAQGAHVNVGGLVASTLNISNADFLAGNNRFTRDGSTGSVVNQGELIGKYVALLAPEVRNEGIIAALEGTVALAAGEAVTLDITGNSLINVQVDAASINTLVENKQMVQAGAGMVIMSAQSANQLLGQVVNSGTVEANGITSDGGVIRLQASSTIDNTGTLSADAAANGKGGTITVIADLANPDSLTTVDGILSAKGGSQSGDGGFIETSGSHLKIMPTASISTKASNGKTGTWLLDPNDFTVAASGGDITGADLTTALMSNNVTIQTTSGTASCTGATCTTGTAGSGDIIVNDAVTVTDMFSLTLEAYRNIEFGSSGYLTFTNTFGQSGALIFLNYGMGGSGYAYAVQGSTLGSGGQFVDIADGGTPGSPGAHGSLVTETLAIDTTSLGYIIGAYSTSAPIYVSLSNGGTSTYGDVLSPVYSMASGGMAMNINSPSGTAAWSWTTGPGTSPGTTLTAGSYTGLAYSSGLTSSYYDNFATGTSASWTVGQRAITLTADNQAKTYGSALTLGSTAYTLSSGTLASGDLISGVTLGSVNGYDASLTQGWGTYNGEITIGGATGSGGFNTTNYNVTYTAGNLTIDRANATVTADSATVTANGQTQTLSGYSFSSLVNGETASIFSAAAIVDTAVNQSAAGTYTHAVSGAATYGNYNLAYVNGTLTINAAATGGDTTPPDAGEIIRRTLSAAAGSDTNMFKDYATTLLKTGEKKAGVSESDQSNAVKYISGALKEYCQGTCDVSTDQMLAWLGGVNTDKKDGELTKVVTPPLPKGKTVDIFVAVVLPQSAGGGVVVRDAEGNWVLWGQNPGGPPPAYKKGVDNQASTSIDLGDNDAELFKKYPGAQLYVGYGTSSGSQPSWNNMINNGSYNLVPTDGLFKNSGSGTSGSGSGSGDSGQGQGGSQTITPPKFMPPPVQ